MATIYLINVLKASALFIVILPYVLMTNFTATRAQIVLHAGLFWLFAPIFITLARAIVSRYFAEKQLIYDLICDFIGLFIAATAMVVIFHLLTGVPYNSVLSPYLWAALLPVFTCYTLIDLYKAWRKQRDQSAELAALNAKTAWQALSAQIKPHFLFNTLAMVEHLVDAEPVVAKKCIQDLAELYRGILHSSAETTISIDKELKTVERYLAIQKLRFGTRLEFHKEVAPDCFLISIPANMLLTCIENAVKHGIEPDLNGGSVEMTIKRRGPFLLIQITNPVASGGSRSGEGFGGEFVRRQLHLLYGEAVSVKQDVVQGKYMTAIEIPVNDNV